VRADATRRHHRAAGAFDAIIARRSTSAPTTPTTRSALAWVVRDSLPHLMSPSHVPDNDDKRSYRVSRQDQDARFEQLHLKGASSGMVRHRASAWATARHEVLRLRMKG
jgi:hypothetical protein